MDLAVALPKFIGSFMSMLAAGSVFFCYLVLPPQKHLRHTLILNLAAADFLNAMNNSISGIYALTHPSIPSGIACTINGWLGQWTVQATDFAVLSISIATVLTLRQFNYQPASSRTMKFLVTLGIWFVPTITSFTGLVLDDYQPVSGNWCWLSADNTALRYALGHGWRLAIIATIICLYAYLFIYMHRHFIALKEIQAVNIDSAADDTANDSDVTYEYNEFEVFHEFEDGYLRAEIYFSEANNIRSPSTPDMKGSMSIDCALASDAKDPQPPPSPSSIMKQILHPHRSESDKSSSFRPLDEKASFLTRDPLALIRRPPPPSLASVSSTSAKRTQVTIKSREYHIQKLLVLNAYPIAYIILWIPGVLNRFVELGGHQNRALNIAQSSTQYVGLANALVYGYNERIWTLATLWWRSRSRKGKAVTSIDRRTDSLAKTQHPEWI